MIYIGDVLFEDFPNTVNINWEITGLCPYKCPYCDRKKELPKVNLQNVIDISKKLKKIYPENTFFQLCITGGEPLTRLDFKSVLNAFNEIFQNGRIILLSNLFLNEKLLQKRFENINGLDKIYLVGSLHLDSKETPESFFKKARMLNSMGFKKTEYKIIIPSWNIDKASAAINLLETGYKDIKSDIRVVRNFHESFDMPNKFASYLSLDDIIVYKSEDHNMKTSYNNLKDLGLNKCLGFNCMLGKKNIFISSDGRLYNALPTNKCSSIIQYGHIRDLKTFYNLQQSVEGSPIKCVDEYCNMECLMVIPKEN